MRETQWGSISNTTEGECSWEVDRTPRSFYGETPEILCSRPGTKCTPDQSEHNRTENWINSSAIHLAERVGITFGTGCRCAKSILSEINAMADESIKGKERMDSNEETVLEEERDRPVVNVA